MFSCVCYNYHFGLMYSYHYRWSFIMLLSGFFLCMLLVAHLLFGFLSCSILALLPFQSFYCFCYFFRDCCDRLFFVCLRFSQFLYVLFYFLLESFVVAYGAREYSSILSFILYFNTFLVYNGVAFASLLFFIFIITSPMLFLSTSSTCR